MKTNTGLKIFSKVTCFLTLFLIFAGGMVTSTDSGLAVPDWPLSYGTLFPPMIGGIFYEHGHRMIASLVGFCMLILSIWITLKDNRKWLKVVGFVGLGAVIAQGILGGLTVLYLLPTPISVSHATLAQTFFLITIFIAYNFSDERRRREGMPIEKDSKLFQAILLCLIMIYLQLIAGAVMRHTGSGLAIYDFPTMAGTYWPGLDKEMLTKINLWRFDNDMELVTMLQVRLHLLHRVGALCVVLCVCILHPLTLQCHLKQRKQLIQTLLIVDGLILTQITLGIATVLTQKSPIITSLHVVTGATTLGVVFLFLLRTTPMTLNKK